MFLLFVSSGIDTICDHELRPHKTISPSSSIVLLDLMCGIVVCLNFKPWPISHAHFTHFQSKQFEKRGVTASDGVKEKSHGVYFEYCFHDFLPSIISRMIFFFRSISFRFISNSLNDNDNFFRGRIKWKHSCFPFAVEQFIYQDIKNLEQAGNLSGSHSCPIKCDRVEHILRFRFPIRSKMRKKKRKFAQ